MCDYVGAVEQVCCSDLQRGHNAVFCVICSLLMFVSDAIGDHMVETYSSMGLVMALYVARIVPFISPMLLM